mgnify:CR=1 FL=1
MSEAKFTNGEWCANSELNYTIDHVDSLECGWREIGSKGVTIAVVTTTNSNDDEMDANFYLMKSAPKMYKMLEMLSGQLTVINAHHAAKEIDDLLSEARGENA